MVYMCWAQRDVAQSHKFVQAQKKVKCLLIGEYTQYNDCYDSSKIVSFTS